MSGRAVVAAVGVAVASDGTADVPTYSLAECEREPSEFAATG